MNRSIKPPKLGGSRINSVLFDIINVEKNIFPFRTNTRTYVHAHVKLPAFRKGEKFIPNETKRCAIEQSLNLQKLEKGICYPIREAKENKEMRNR